MHYHNDVWQKLMLDSIQKLKILNDRNSNLESQNVWIQYTISSTILK